MWKTLGRSELLRLIIVRKGQKKYESSKMRKAKVEAENRFCTREFQSKGRGVRGRKEFGDVASRSVNGIEGWVANQRVARVGRARG